MNLQRIITNKKYLFLDRDGVINKRIVDGYITKWEDFEILPGVLEAINIFSKYFERIIIITNQQGIGKRLMTEETLKQIHQKFYQEVINSGGYIDGFYFCPMLKIEDNNCRKPGIKMALQAQEDFPDIDLKKCIMIGDTASDMLFAKNAGMAGILLENNETTLKDKEYALCSIKTLTELSTILK